MAHTIKVLARQLLLQQFNAEERTRSAGASGIKRIRLPGIGSKPYLTPTYAGDNFAGAHDHSNYKDTIGLGELVAVLNGVEFRTRHLDYKLKMKSKNSGLYGTNDDIEYPDVPPDVLNIPSVDGQTKEMKEWFRAWRDQDPTVRDYRRYFRPVLCYLEGMWTHSDELAIDESFESDRHHLDAQSWLDMQEKIRFASYTGNKDLLENFAYLPTTIMDVSEDGTPSLAQWNVQVLCHPLDQDLPLDRIRLVDDILIRMSHQQELSQYQNSRAARYRVSPNNRSSITDRAYKHALLDELMGQIPGLDNYRGDMIDDAFEHTAYPVNGEDDKPLNVAYYHRWFRTLQADAMGHKKAHKGFGDENVFMARNSQSKCAGLKLEVCEDDANLVCNSFRQKMSFAIPLEIIYLTPLTNWNPYGILYKGHARTNDGKSVKLAGPKGARTGTSADVDLAYNGTNSEIFYRVPYSFFDGEIDPDAADTVQDSFYILDDEGTPRRVKASGHRILMDIDGVGVTRQRYPIAPLHEEGSSTWKLVEALADIVLEPNTYRRMLREEVQLPVGGSHSHISSPSQQTKDDPDSDKVLHFWTTSSSKATGSHVHRIKVTVREIERINGGERLLLKTDTVDGHQHHVQVAGVKKSKNGNPYMLYFMALCDFKKTCEDGHSRKLIPEW